MRPRVPVVGIRLVREATLPWPEGIGRQVNTPAAAAAVIGSWIAEWDRECFVVLLLNTRHRVLAAHTVSVGGLDNCPVHPREVFRLAVMQGAAAIICGHNHPSGDPEPSADDRRITAVLAAAGKVVGVDVLDHLVVASDERGRRYVSLKERGEMAGLAG